MKKHLITLEKAVTLTTLYCQQKETILAEEFQGKDILPLSETMDSWQLGDRVLKVIERKKAF